MNLIFGLFKIAILVGSVFAFYKAYTDPEWRLRVFAWCFGVIVGIILGASTGVAFGGIAFNGAPLFAFIFGTIAVLAVSNIQQLWNKWHQK